MTLPPALVFDWGDTLMRDFSQDPDLKPGLDPIPMVDWPEVAAVDGAASALEALRGRARLFVATNADRSSADQVSAALARCKLDGYFERVFTMHELGSRKPQPAFFLRLSELIGVAPSNCVMIGDHFGGDVLGSLGAGWRAVWVNPDNRPAPGLTPLHHGDVDHMADLPAALERLHLPGVETCLGWLQQNTTALNLVQHQVSVAAVAYRMALWMRSNGTAVDPILAHRGGLLHDIGKIKPQIEGEKPGHGEAGARILEALGQPELAETTRRHLLLGLANPEKAPETWEQKLVYFADKVVEGSGLVTVEDRMHRLKQRYSLDSKPVDELMPTLMALQDELCRHAGFAPEDLAPRLKEAFQRN